MADIIRCDDCGYLGLDDPQEPLCPQCSSADLIAWLDGTELYSQEQLKQLWLIFGDLAMNPDTEELEEEFLYFPVGTGKETIWYWFDERFEGGVYKLLYEFDEE